jgi:hypothetical protein
MPKTRWSSIECRWNGVQISDIHYAKVFDRNTVCKSMVFSLKYLCCPFLKSEKWRSISPDVSLKMKRRKVSTLVLSDNTFIYGRKICVAQPSFLMVCSSLLSLMGNLNKTHSRPHQSDWKVSQHRIATANGGFKTKPFKNIWSEVSSETRTKRNNNGRKPCWIDLHYLQ